MRSLRVLLVGYGKMGIEIKKCLLLRGHSVAAIVDPYTEHHYSTVPDVPNSTPVDVAIDFSTSESFLRGYRHYTTRGVSAVIGTTGWYDAFDAVAAAFREAECGCLYGTNFSVGAQMFLKLVAEATKLFSPISAYDFMLTEMHHKQKKDSPSGTAKSAAQIIIQNHPRKQRTTSDSLQRAIDSDELHVTSVRGGSIPGVHTLTIDSPFDSITVTHTARTREGFALGAVLGAEWIVGRNGIHNIQDVIGSIVTGGKEK